MSGWLARGNLRHLDAAYNLARWLTLDPRGAESVVEEAYGCANRASDGGGKAALLARVRDCSRAWLDRPRSAAAAPRAHGGSRADRALEGLSIAYREILVLHDLEGLTSAEISAATGIAPDTVTSRLATARELLARALAEPTEPHLAAESVFR